MFSVLGSEEGSEGGAAPGESGLDGPLWTMLDPCDLVEGEVAEMVEHDRPPLCLRQLLERRDKDRGRLRRRRFGSGPLDLARNPTAVRARRQRETASRVATWRTHAPGSSYSRDDHRGQARL